MFTSYTLMTIIVFLAFYFEHREYGTFDKFGDYGTARRLLMLFGGLFWIGTTFYLSFTYLP